MKMLALPAAVAAILGLAGSSLALAQTTPPPPPPVIGLVDYYSGAGGFPPAFAGTLRLSNPGSIAGTSPAGDLCALIYVFDAKEHMIECCGCKLIPDGLLTLSIQTNLLSNPNNPGPGTTNGLIKIVSSAPNALGACNPSIIVAQGQLDAWGAHLHPTGSVLIETQSRRIDFSTADVNRLQNVCGVIRSNSSGHGLCTCQ
jgi:hypothetical protein